MSKLKHITAFTFEFRYKGTDISVHGKFIPADRETFSTQGSPERFIIDTVKYLNGEDVIEGDVNLESLEEFILETQMI